MLKTLTEDLDKAKAYSELITRVKEETAREVDKLFESKSTQLLTRNQNLAEPQEPLVKEPPIKQAIHNDKP